MKRILVFVLLSILAIGSSASAQTCDCGDLQAQVDALTLQVQTLLDQMDAVDLGDFATSPTPSGKGMTFRQLDFDGFSLDVYARRVLKTTSGLDVLEVFFLFENTGDEVTNLSSELRLKAFQNGACLLEGQVHGFAKDVRPGKKIDMRKTFVLLKTDIPVELEFTPLRSGVPELRTIDLP